jgi:transcriptional regulator with XRE-family HTH domain
MFEVTVKRIEKLCAERNITITFLENSIEISKGSIRTWNRVKPSIDKIIKIAEFFDVSADYILGLSNSRRPVDDEENDKGLVSLKRARSKMSEAEKNNMDILMSIAFAHYFKEDDDGDD